MTALALGASECVGQCPVVRRLAEARPRRPVLAIGEIVAARTVRHGGAPAWRAEFSDGSGSVDLLFIGRTSVPGLGVGAHCTVEGTCLAEGGRLVVWNPRYELLRRAP